MKVFTIGFTQKNAEKFFGLLKQSGAKRVVDVRLNNVSQLAGFAKKNDLAFFAKQIAGMDYVHLPELAPTQDILDEYKKNKGDWNVYEKKFLSLMEQYNGSHEDYDYFLVPTVKDKKLQDRLRVAVSGGGTMRNFLDALTPIPAERERWYKFRESRIRERLLSWLKQNGMSGG